MEPFEDRDIVVVDLGFGDAGEGSNRRLALLRPSRFGCGRSGPVQRWGTGSAQRDGRRAPPHVFAVRFGNAVRRPDVSLEIRVGRAHRPRPGGACSGSARSSKSVRSDTDRRARIVDDADSRGRQQAREDARGGNRHGSCGKGGIGETAAYALEVADAPTVGDCRRPDSLRRKLSASATFYGPLIAESRHGFPPIDDMVDMYAEFGAVVDIADPDALGALGARGRLVFEGAQGVLLDEWRGFHPHTTWSTVEPSNARAMIDELGRDSYVLGVTRTYMTRHGAGPFPTEDPELAKVLPELHNGTGEYQGGFRMATSTSCCCTTQSR